MGYIINAIKAFVSKEPNEFNEGNLSVAEKKELDEIRKEDKTEAIEPQHICKNVKEVGVDKHISHYCPRRQKQ